MGRRPADPGESRAGARTRRRGRGGRARPPAASRGRTEPGRPAGYATFAEGRPAGRVAAPGYLITTALSRPAGSIKGSSRVMRPPFSVSRVMRSPFRARMRP